MLELSKFQFDEGVNSMTYFKKEYIFPENERKIFINAGRILFPLEMILHITNISLSIKYQNLDGVWLSLFFAVIFASVHFQNLRFRKYCLAKWSFDGKIFAVYVKDMCDTIDTSYPFCIATTELTFNRRYSFVKYPFIMIWKPGDSVPYEEMNGYQALKKREALIIPYDDTTIALLHEHLNVKEIPQWPKSHVYYGISR